MAKPGPAPSVTPEDVLDVFAAREDPTEPLTASEVADALGCSRRTALDRLGELDEGGGVASKKVGGRARVWWVPPDAGGGSSWRDGFGAFAGADSGFAEHARGERAALNAGLEERRRDLS